MNSTLSFTINLWIFGTTCQMLKSIILSKVCKFGGSKLRSIVRKKYFWYSKSGKKTVLRLSIVVAVVKEGKLAISIYLKNNPPEQYTGNFSTEKYQLQLFAMASVAMGCRSRFYFNLRKLAACFTSFQHFPNIPGYSWPPKRLLNPSYTLTNSLVTSKLSWTSWSLSNRVIQKVVDTDKASRCL